jgi:hypothetical protein
VKENFIYPGAFIFSDLKAYTSLSYNDMTRKTKQSNLQIIKVWYLAQIRNRSMQVAVPKAPGTRQPKHKIINLHMNM